MKNLQTIPGIGPKMAQRFLDIGIKSPSDLKGKDPTDLYLKLCANENQLMDRCVLYVCRCAIYFAETPDPDPEKLNWWWWKDRK